MSVARHRFTVEEYHRMGEAGIFGEDDRVELVEGEVVEMTPIGDRHAECVMRLTRLLVRFARDGYTVSVQNPVHLDEQNEPQPDLVLLGEPGRKVGVPVPADILLLIEVSDSSLDYDRDVKLPLYSSASLPEAWVVNLAARVVEVHSVPTTGGYATVSRFGRGEKVFSATVPDLAAEAAELLPPAGE